MRPSRRLPLVTLVVLAVVALGVAAPAVSVADTAAAGASSAMSEASTVDANSFNRLVAMSWGLAHAQDPQPFPAACTWFVSNALWRAGFPKTAEWTDRGSYGPWPWSHRPGTPTANVVPMLSDYLQVKHLASFKWLGDLSKNAVPEAQVGDVIVYSWDEGKTWDHMSLVVGFADGQYPLVSEWGSVDFKFGHKPSPYAVRGWTWSAISNPPNWLQAKDNYNGRARAYLLHITA